MDSSTGITSLSNATQCDTSEWLHLTHRIVELSIHSVSIFLNIVLLVLVEKHSGDNAGPYTNIFRLTCISDLVTSFFATFAQKIILTNHADVVFMSISFFSRRSPELDFFGVFSATSSFYASVILLPLQYVYHYLSLYSNAKTRRKAVSLAIIIALCVTFAGSYVTYKALRPTSDFQEKARCVLLETGWSCVDFDDAPFSYGGNFFEPRIQLFFCVVTYITLFGYVVIGTSQLMSFRRVQSIGVASPPSDGPMHNEFRRALAALAFCPLVCVMFPLIYFIVVCALRANGGILSSFVTTATSSIALANPIVVIATVPPYRRKVADWLKSICARKKAKNTTLTMAFNKHSRRITLSNIKVIFRPGA